MALHRRLPGYQATPLLDLPALARRLEIGRLYVKDETSRLGLPAFKILGASWATYRALEQRLGSPLPAWDSLDQLRRLLSPLGSPMLSAATDGNHGRALARMARLLHLPCSIYVPSGTSAARMKAITGEGAQVHVVQGSYDEAVRMAATRAEDNTLVISDTSWPGYEVIPQWIIEGYSTIMWETADQLADRGWPPPDVVVVQVGVGALAAAVVSHYHSTASNGPKLLTVEPTNAACLIASIEAGQPVSVPPPLDSAMVGLNCGTPSLIAWPLLSRGVDALISTTDARAWEAVRLFQESGIASGETGAAGLAGLMDVQDESLGLPIQKALGIQDNSSVLLLCTEGPTDPESYAQILAATSSGN